MLAEFVSLFKAAERPSEIDDQAMMQDFYLNNLAVGAFKVHLDTKQACFASLFDSEGDYVFKEGRLSNAVTAGFPYILHANCNKTNVTALYRLNRLQEIFPHRRLDLSLIRCSGGYCTFDPQSSGVSVSPEINPLTLLAASGPHRNRLTLCCAQAGFLTFRPKDVGAGTQYLSSWEYVDNSPDFRTFHGRRLADYSAFSNESFALEPVRLDFLLRLESDAVISFLDWHQAQL